MPRKLPLYVVKQKNRAGNWVHYFRVGKGPCTRLPAPNDPSFKQAYEAVLKGEPSVAQAREVPNTIAWLIGRFMESGDWRDTSPATRRQRSNILWHVKEKPDGKGGKIGDKPFSVITTKAIRNGMEIAERPRPQQTTTSRRCPRSASGRLRTAT